jgi:hypothetical protein
LPPPQSLQVDFYLAQTKETDVRTSSATIVIIAAISTAMLLSNAQPASAKKEKAKPTYEQAWTLCNAELDRSHILKADAGQRYAAGAGCMLRHGYHI